MRKHYLLTSLILVSFHILNAQVIDDLFQRRTNLSKDYHKVARKYEALELNTSKLSAVRQRSSSSLQLQLPFEGRQLKLRLEKVNITSENFSVMEARADGSRQAIDYAGGIFYQGKIDGMSSSFATISIVNDQVFGVIADNQGNIILGAIENNGIATNEYALYREADLQVPNPLNCFTEETPVEGTITNNINDNAKLNAVGEPVDIYFECDFRFYQDKGSNTINVINYVLSFFNNTALLYANENIKIQVSQILVWTTSDPEVVAGLSTSQACLTSFSSRMLTTNYVGDYAHFLSTRSLGGGVAYLPASPCASSKQFRTGVSGIYNTYSNFPTYSWTVQVVTHELGHNLGSNHTHWCGWAGGAIDNCGPTAGYANEGGSCSLGPTPSGGGTIMSYCHLVGSVGINFNNGFGQQPGDKIRSVVSGAACFGNCRMTLDVTKQDASCGQNNGSATASATNGTGALVYIWSNGHIGPTLSNAAPGTYHVTVGDASGCQVMQVVSIGNSGSTLTFSLTPSGTAGLCTGGNLPLNATNNASYTYVWRKDGNIINGATTSTYNVTSAGTYAVTAISGSCSGTQSVIVSSVPSPAASIMPGGVTTFCDGNNVVLNGNAGSSYSYEWYNNGTAINGATSAVYIATASGNYTVKVSAGTGCEITSSPVAVTVNPSPIAVISAATPASFCAGGSVTLNTSTGTGYSYQWYRNGSILAGSTESSYTTNTAGSYTVITSLGTCSKTSAATNVVVFSNPVINVSPVISTIQKFQTQILTGSGGVSYNWNIQPAFIGSAGNNSTFKPLTTTNYTVQGTDANGCKGTATATINVIGCGNVTGITVTTYSPSRAIIRWTNPDGADADTLQYRKTGSVVWTKVYVTGEEYELNGLTPGTDYEYNIIPLCNTTTVYIPSQTNTFKTDPLTGGLYLRLFPNPVSSASKLEIITDNNFTLQVSVFDNTGRKVVQVSSSENLPPGQVIKTINAGVLSNGIYHIAVNINGKLHSVKMLVMH